MKTLIGHKFSILVLSLFISAASAHAVTPGEIQACQTEAAGIQASIDTFNAQLDELELKYDNDRDTWQARCDDLREQGKPAASQYRQCKADMKAVLNADKSAMKSKRSLISTSRRQLGAKNSSCRKLENTFRNDCNKDDRAVRNASRDVDRYTRQLEILVDQINNAILNKQNIIDNFRRQMDDLKARQDWLIIEKATCFFGNSNQCASLAQQIINIQRRMSQVDHSRELALKNADRRITQLAIKYDPLNAKLGAATVAYNNAVAVFNQAQCPVN